MTDTRVALASDRLPWLEDVPERRRTASARSLWAWGAAVVLLVAGASYWLGLQSRTGEPPPVAPSTTQRTVTTPLPEPQALPPPGQLEIVPAPLVEPTPEPQVRPAPAPRPVLVQRTPATKGEAEAQRTTESAEKAGVSASESERDSAVASAAPAAQTPAPPKLASASELKLWPARVTDGAHGRLVQIGAFGSVHQAKVGWKRMARAYPGVKRLPAVVRPARNSKGKTFYRFQIGTTSQAHSEVLCQRMQKIDFSCAVVGLPWKEKVER